MFNKIFEDLFGSNTFSGNVSGDMVGNISGGHQGTKGNGKVITVDCSQYLSEDVRQIVTDGIINFVISDEVGLLLDLEIEENLVDCVVITNKNGILHVACKNMQSTKSIKVTLRKPSKITGITTSGVGNFDGIISTNSLVLNKSGVGNVTLRGTSDTLVIIASGVGNVNTKSVKTVDLKVNCSGTGSVVASASKSLDCDVSGVCSVTVHDQSAGGLIMKKCNTSGLGKLKVI